jgi:hypothetical protein
MRHAFVLALGALGALALWVGAAPGTSPPGERQAPEFPRRDPDAWLNSRPLSMAGLRGRVVILDVWTFG